MVPEPQKLLTILHMSPDINDFIPFISLDLLFYIRAIRTGVHSINLYHSFFIY